MDREVHYYVHGRGRGHAARALTTVPRLLEAGFQVRLFAGRGVHDWLKRELPCQPIYSLLPNEPYLTGPKLVQRSLWAFSRSLRRSPLAVISDGDLPSSMAAACAGVPVISIGHGLLFSCADAPNRVDRAAWSREAAKASRASVGSRRQLVVGFAPATLRRPSARLVRPPLSPPLPQRPRSGGVLCYFRDENALPVLSELRALGMTPTLFGNRDPGLPGVRFEALDRQRFLTALSEADAVVSSSGCQLIAECLSLDVPHLALYRSGDDEQRLNAELLVAQGLLMAAPLERLRRGDLLAFVGSLDEQRQTRRERRPLDALPELEQVLVEELAGLLD